MEEEILKILEDNTPEQSEASLLAVQQYNPDTHDVMNTQKRKDKTVYKPTFNSAGDPILNDEGKAILNPYLEPVNRVAVSMQQTIVSTRKHFMNLRNSVLYCDNDQSELLTAVNRVRKLNKYAFKIEEIAERTMSELSAAEMWWINPEGDIKMRVLSPEKGDIMLPLFDEYGDMKYFLRQYVVGEDTLTDVFTATVNYTFDEDNNIVNTWTNAWGKIPIIYYSQELPEWYNVQTIIERFETLISNFADNNDYTGSPITIIKGNPVGFVNKGDQGKTIQLQADADIKYLTAENSSESIDSEKEELKELMYTMSHTPNFSIEALKGAATSGVAFDRLFTDAQLTAESKLTGTFGESMQRSVNLLSAMLRVVDTSLPDDIIEVETKAYRFDDLETEVKNAVLLKGLLSDETLTKMMAGIYGIDEGEEWERVKSEKGTQTIESIEEEEL